jgi:pyruvate dehydrogenase E2 component (dihydrolipoamide acetyltransferase)
VARVIEMPKLSDTMEEGGIANWLKKEGDSVKEGEPLVEIETDKATQEYESPAEGVLLKIIAQPGGKAVPLRGPIAVIGEKGEKVDLDALIAKSSPAAKAAAPAAKPAPATNVVDIRPAAASQLAPAPTPAPAPAVNAGGRVRSSPLARKIAAEKGINLSNVHGSGPGGRVVMKDLENAPAGGAVGAPPSTHVHAAAAESRSVPVSMMRKTIAKRLLAAKNEAPHFYLTVSANMTRANEWRERLNAEAAKAAKSGGDVAKVSVNDLVIMAVARSLRLHPMVNASWQGDTILMNGPVHVAMAVALPEGLVTPVIRDTDRLGVREIARQSRDLATRAKDGKLGNNDYMGGTFTISNLGMFGIEEFTAIINPPQACILAVGATQVVPAVDDKGAVVAQARMKMTMSCDHRVVDGASGAQFLKTLVGYLEDPLNMLA